MTFSCRGWCEELTGLHLVGVGVGIKKPRGFIGSGNMHFCYYLSHSEGSRTMAQSLGGVKGERSE